VFLKPLLIYAAILVGIIVDVVYLSLSAAQHRLHPLQPLAVSCMIIARPKEITPASNHPWGFWL
jgi:hypothetical protein